MQGLLAKAKTYIKVNWLFVLIMALGAIALFAQLHETVLYADDYSLGIYADGNPETLFRYFTTHYTSWGGGYTGVLVIIALGLPSILWKTFFTIMLACFVGLTTKMLCKNHQTYKWLTALVLWASVFVLSILVSREVIYWLDGGMAYLFSMFQAFLVFYFMYTRLFQDVSKKYDIVLLPIVTFFGGWSSAQSGLAAVAITVILILWRRFIDKQPIKKLYYISAILSLIGFMIFYFAPGNSVRMDTFTEYESYNLFQKIGYRIGSVTSHILNNTQSEFTAAPIFVYLTIGLTAIVDLKYSLKTKNKKLKIFRMICSAYAILFLLSFMFSVVDILPLSPGFQYIYKYINLLTAGEHGILGYFGIIPLLIAALAAISNLVSGYFISREHKNPFLITAIFIAYLTEFAMVMAPYSPIRTTFYTIAFMWVAIAYLILIAKKDDINTFGIITIVFTSLNLYLGLIMLILYAIFIFILPKAKFTPTAQIYLFLSVFTMISITNYAKILINYHRNRVIDEENITRIINAKTTYDETGKLPETLYLVRPHNVLYGFTGLAGIDWVESAVNDYYGLPITLNLEYEGETQ